jgi:hypothetical protein
MKTTFTIAVNLFVALALSCLAYGAQAAPPDAPIKKDLTFLQLKNTTYLVPNKAGVPQPITMTAGSGNRGSQVMIGLEKASFGDLNKDGVKDAATVYWLNTGDDAYWRILGAFISKDGEAVNVDNKTIGNKVNVVSVTVVDGRIELVIMDPSANPPAKKMFTFVIKNDRLVQVDNVKKPAPKPADPGKPPVKPNTNPTKKLFGGFDS